MWAEKNLGNDGWMDGRTDGRKDASFILTDSLCKHKPRLLLVIGSHTTIIIHKLHTRSQITIMHTSNQPQKKKFLWKLPPH